MVTAVRPETSVWRDRRRRASLTAAGAGLDLHRLLAAGRDVPTYLRNRRQWRRAGGSGEVVTLPMLSDRRSPAGDVLGHYFRQDLWVAARVLEERPDRHVDVGSRIDGFVAHLLAVREVEVVDVRPLPIEVPGLVFVQDDGRDLATLVSGSVPSLSSLHAIEHFGLGRYGDPIDVGGAGRAIGAFIRVLQPGGRLWLSVPVGRPRVEFDAHRIFDPVALLAGLAPLQLEHFASIDDEGVFSTERPPEELLDSTYACGIYGMRKSS